MKLASTITAAVILSLAPFLPGFCQGANGLYQGVDYNSQLSNGKLFSTSQAPIALPSVGTGAVNLTTVSNQGLGLGALTSAIQLGAGLMGSLLGDIAGGGLGNMGGVFYNPGIGGSPGVTNPNLSGYDFGQSVSPYYGNPSGYSGSGTNGFADTGTMSSPTLSAQPPAAASGTMAPAAEGGLDPNGVSGSQGSMDASVMSSGMNNGGTGGSSGGALETSDGAFTP